MKIINLPIYILSALFSFNLSGAWIIDDSCTGPLGEAFKEALLNAGKMARQAHAALEANPRTQSTEDLYNKLFDPVDTARDNVKRILKGVGDRIPGGSNPGSDRTDENEIIFVCDFSRLVDRDTGKYDPLTDEYITGTEADAGSQDDYNKCASEDYKQAQHLAYTAIFKRNADGNPQQLPPTIIQLCPWFTELIKRKKYSTLSEWPTLVNIAANAWIAKKKITGLINQMDIYALLDHVLFHEMTHTKDLETQDVGGFPHAYFWVNVQNMIGGSNNADSITYFAQGIDLIVNYNSIPQADGNMKPSQSLLSGGAHKIRALARRVRKIVWRA